MLGHSQGGLGPSFGGLLVSPSPPTGLGGNNSFHPFPPLFAPQLHLNFTTSTSLNFTSLLTRRGAHFDPLGRPKSTPNRPKSPLEPSFSPKSRFSKKRAPLEREHDSDPKTAPKIDPRRLQDDLQEHSFFDFVFDIDFAPSWVEIGPHLGPLWGPKIGPSRGA